jgi:DNA-binding response OmpR family regulator
MVPSAEDGNFANGLERERQWCHAACARTGCIRRRGTLRTYIWRGNTIDILLLGPFQVWVDDHPVSLTSSRQRALLGTLALSAGRLVSVDALARCVWGEELLQRIRGSLQTNVIAVTAPPRRRRLGD